MLPSPREILSLAHRRIHSPLPDLWLPSAPGAPAAHSARPALNVAPTVSDMDALAPQNTSLHHPHHAATCPTPLSDHNDPAPSARKQHANSLPLTPPLTPASVRPAAEAHPEGEHAIQPAVPAFEEEDHRDDDDDDDPAVYAQSPVESPVASPTATPVPLPGPASAHPVLAAAAAAAALPSPTSPTYPRHRYTAPAAFPGLPAEQLPTDSGAYTPQRAPADEEHPTRFLFVSNVPPAASSAVLKAAFAPCGDLKGIFVRFQAAHGVIVLAFFDLRHALRARAQINAGAVVLPTVPPDSTTTTTTTTTDTVSPGALALRARFVSPAELSHRIGPSAFVSQIDGDLRVRAVPVGGAPARDQGRDAPDHDPALDTPALQGVLARFGDLRGFAEVLPWGSSAGAGAAYGDGPDATREFTVSYFDARDAAEALAALHGRVVLGVRLEVQVSAGVGEEAAPAGAAVTAPAPAPAPGTKKPATKTKTKTTSPKPNPNPAPAPDGDIRIPFPHFDPDPEPEPALAPAPEFAAAGAYYTPYGHGHGHGAAYAAYAYDAAYAHEYARAYGYGYVQPHYEQQQPYQYHPHHEHEHEHQADQQYEHEHEHPHPTPAALERRLSVDSLLHNLRHAGALQHSVSEQNLRARAAAAAAAAITAPTSGSHPPHADAASHPLPHPHYAFPHPHPHAYTPAVPQLHPQLQLQQAQQDAQQQQRPPRVTTPPQYIHARRISNIYHFDSVGKAPPRPIAVGRPRSISVASEGEGGRGEVEGAGGDADAVDEVGNAGDVPSAWDGEAEEAGGTPSPVRRALRLAGEEGSSVDADAEASPRARAGSVALGLGLGLGLGLDAGATRALPPYQGPLPVPGADDPQWPASERRASVGGDGGDALYFMAPRASHSHQHASHHHQHASHHHQHAHHHHLSGPARRQLGLVPVPRHAHGYGRDAPGEFAERESPRGSGGGGGGERDAPPERNRIDVGKIERGEETRTTVMIKNIPNKMSDRHLIEFINGVCPRKIDFLYLRMDFTNGCNVGYAFVNFIRVEDLLHFAKTKLGTKWNLFSSEKVLGMSYANYQGKEALIDKFRSSSIMDQREAWRPKLFYSHGPKKGLPEDFPAPTHMRRKERAGLLPSELHQGRALFHQPSASVSGARAG